MEHSSLESIFFTASSAICCNFAIICKNQLETGMQSSLNLNARALHCIGLQVAAELIWRIARMEVMF